MRELPQLTRPAQKAFPELSSFPQSFPRHKEQADVSVGEVQQSYCVPHTSQKLGLQRAGRNTLGLSRLWGSGPSRGLDVMVIAVILPACSIYSCLELSRGLRGLPASDQLGITAFGRFLSAEAKPYSHPSSCGTLVGAGNRTWVFCKSNRCP